MDRVTDVRIGRRMDRKRDYNYKMADGHTNKGKWVLETSAMPQSKAYLK